MAAAFTAKLEGLDAFLAKLKTLKQSTQNKVLRPAIKKASNLVAKAVKPLVPVGATGNLKRSIKAFVAMQNNVVIGIVKAQSFFKRRVKKQQVDVKVGYGLIVEGGAKPHAVGKGSRLRSYTTRKGELRPVITVGRMHPGFKGREFMRAGWNESKGRAADLVLSEAAKNLQKIWKG